MLLCLWGVVVRGLKHAGGDFADRKKANLFPTSQEVTGGFGIGGLPRGRVTWKRVFWATPADLRVLLLFLDRSPPLFVRIRWNVFLLRAACAQRIVRVRQQSQQESSKDRWTNDGSGLIITIPQRPVDPQAHLSPPSLFCGLRVTSYEDS